MKKKELNKLKRSLPANWCKLLSDETGLAKSTISMVLAGHRNNMEVIKAAIILAKENKSNTEILVKEIAEL